MRILLTKLKHIGDALLMTPTVCAIRARHPDAEIVVVVRKGTEGILKGCPAIDRVLTAAAPEEHRRSRWNWLEDLKLILELRKQRFDYAIELGDGDRGRWICALASAKVRSTNDAIIRLHPSWRIVFRSISQYQWGYRHRVEKDFFTVGHCLELGDAPPALCFDRSRATESWASREAGERCIVFHPATRLREKLWPEDRWIEVGRALLSRGCRIAISVGPAAEEVALGERIAAGIGPQAFSTRGELGWPELAHLLYSARLFVGVDTAAMHLAAACQCPTVAIFGMTSFIQWKPWQCRNRVVAALSEREELSAEAARGDNPVHRISVQAVRAALEDLEKEVGLAGCSAGSVDMAVPERLSGIPESI
jgi:heptosyltransferase-3